MQGHFSTNLARHYEGRYSAFDVLADLAWLQSDSMPLPGLVSPDRIHDYLLHSGDRRQVLFTEEL